MDGESGFEKLCRICTNRSEGVYIFSKEGKDISLEEKIKKFLSITVSEDDSLPKTVCCECAGKLDGIQDFVQMAIVTQIKLSEMLRAAKENSRQRQLMETHHDEQSVKGSLLHSILTKEKEREREREEQMVTELEVTVDPMLFLADQEGVEEDEPEPAGKSSPESSGISSRSDSQSNSEEEAVVIGAAGSGSYGGIIDGKPYQCTVCPRGFNSDLSLKNHLWGHMSMRKVLASSDLVLNRFPSEGKHRVVNSECLCNVCGRVYPTRSTLRAHQITHSNLRPHKCSLCDKTFKRNQDLKFHINQHTGERPYRCPYCPKAFASSGNCFSHRKRMHPKQLARDKKAAGKQFL